MIDNFAVWEAGSGSSCKKEGTFVDGCDETCSEDDTCCEGTVETLIHAERGNDL